MRVFSSFFVFIAGALVSAATAGAAELTVTVNNMEAAGEMHLAVYDKAAVFEGDLGDESGKRDGIVDGVVARAGPGSATWTFDLPAGTYAVGLYLDVNGNNKMDKNFLGMPKEQYGFSNNAKGRFGPPSFEDASFNLVDRLTLEIDL